MPCMLVFLQFNPLYFIKVLITKEIQKIPVKHIMKRWTVDARDMLPAHIKHYQKDMGPPEAMTFRHSAMYITALELVHMGDSNPDAFELVMTGLCELKAKAAVVCDVKDGKSIVEKSKASSVSNSVGSRKTDCSNKNTGTVRLDSSISGGSIVGTSAHGVDTGEVTSRNPNYTPEMLAPERKLKRGLPTTARDKPPYEQNGKRTRFCSICRTGGHKSTTCPDRGDRSIKPRKDAQCSNCGLTGHRKTSCSKPMVSLMPGLAGIGL